MLKLFDMQFKLITPQIDRETQIILQVFFFYNSSGIYLKNDKNIFK